MQNDKFEVSEELDELFDFIHPSIARKVMWDWLKVTVAGNFATAIKKDEKALIINVYEKIDNLLRAAEKDYQRKRSLSK